jgi:hypothetical protein
MISILLTIFILLGVAFSILVASHIFHWVIAQIQNTTLPENTNDTRRIINLRDNTITVINTTTNETIRTMPYLGNTGNMTSGNTGNMTTNDTLTEKFKALGK